MIVQDLESVECLRKSISVHTIEIIEMSIPLKGQITVAAEVMHIITYVGLVSAEMLGKQSLSRDVRQCDEFEW